MIVEEMEVNYGLHAVVSFMSTLVGCSINRVFVVGWRESCG